MNMPKSLFLVIFGASGDLTRRKLMPSLVKIFFQKRSPENFAIIGTARSVYDDESYRGYLRQYLQTSPSLSEEERGCIEDFLKIVYYQTIDPAECSSYLMLDAKIESLSTEYDNSGNLLFYLATPPSLYEIIPECLSKSGILKKKGPKRIIVEKPFGYDLKSAKKLNSIYSKYFKEEDIYRIDHFLGKETVQNIMVTRFGSTIYEPIWNRNYIDYVEITAVENMGIENRGGYYDHAGALRDMVQNHLMQLLALTAMEPPARFDKDSFRNEVIKVYQSISDFSESYIKDNIIRGQYTESETSKGYRQEKGIGADSRTDTYIAMCLYIDNWRWEGVPFFIRTGKNMPTKVTEIVVHFKPAPLKMFKLRDEHRSGEKLILRIQPNEGIVQRVAMKSPGSGFFLGNMEMEFSYEKSRYNTGDAYVRLIEDSIAGDPTLFTRQDAVEQSWEMFEKILEYWDKHPDTHLYGYPAGTWGPKEADELIAKVGAEWTNPCKNLTNSNLYCEL
jgi:glucose-6-phosphate 1-dehydrogenase